MIAMNALKVGLEHPRAVSREDVLDYISTKAQPGDLLQILDALIDPVSSYLGCATGIENDRHAVLMQIQADELPQCASQ